MVVDKLQQEVSQKIKQQDARVLINNATSLGDMPRKHLHAISRPSQVDLCFACVKLLTNVGVGLMHGCHVLCHEHGGMPTMLSPAPLLS